MIKRMRRFISDKILGFPESDQPTGIPVYFDVLHEVHDRRQFQSEGHFVPGLRERDAEGNLTLLPRKWEGSKVHALTLMTEGGKQVFRIVNPYTNEPQSAFRALSDSREDAEILLRDQIRQGFWAAQSALQIASFNADQARRTKDERDRLVAGLLQRGMGKDLSEILGIGEAAVAEFQRQEASADLKAKVEDLLRGTN